MTILDDLPTGVNASTLADGPEWSLVMSAVSPTGLRQEQQQAPLIVEMNLSSRRRLNPGNLSRAVTSAELEKLRHLLREINCLLAMPKDWDGRGSGPINVEVVRNAIPVIGSLMLLTPTPVELFGQADGGLQAEWHLGNADVEIEFDADGDIVSLIRDQSGDRHVDYFGAMRDRVRTILAESAGSTAARPQ